jgi:hypothetical protein
MPHVDCPYCGKLGTVTGERVIQGQNSLTTYFCDSCHNEWDEREGEGGRRSEPRQRAPRTRHETKTRN